MVAQVKANTEIHLMYFLLKKEQECFEVTDPN